MVGKNKKLVQLIINRYAIYREKPNSYANLIYSFSQLELCIDKLNWFRREQNFSKRMTKYWPTQN